jgi:hypothetical protein
MVAVRDLQVLQRDPLIASDGSRGRNSSGLWERQALVGIAGVAAFDAGGLSENA